MFLINDSQVPESQFRQVFDETTVWLKEIQGYYVTFRNLVTYTDYNLEVSINLHELLEYTDKYIQVEPNIPYLIRNLHLTGGRATHV